MNLLSREGTTCANHKFVPVHFSCAIARTPTVSFQSTTQLQGLLYSHSKFSKHNSIARTIKISEHHPTNVYREMPCSTSLMAAKNACCTDRLFSNQRTALCCLFQHSVLAFVQLTPALAFILHLSPGWGLPFLQPSPISRSRWSNHVRQTYCAVRSFFTLFN